MGFSPEEPVKKPYVKYLYRALVSLFAIVFIVGVVVFSQVMSKRETFSASPELVSVASLIPTSTFKVTFIADFPLDPVQGMKGTTYTVTWEGASLVASDESLWIWPTALEVPSEPGCSSSGSNITWRPFTYKGVQYVIYNTNFVNITTSSSEIALLGCP